MELLFACLMIFNITRPLKGQRRRWLLMSPIKPSFILPFVPIPGQILLSNTCLLKRCILRRDVLALNVREDSPASLLPAQHCDVQEKGVIEKSLRVLAQILIAGWDHIYFWMFYTHRSWSFVFWPLNLEGLTRTRVAGAAFFIFYFIYKLTVYDHRADREKGHKWRTWTNTNRCARQKLSGPIIPASDAEQLARTCWNFPNGSRACRPSLAASWHWDGLIREASQALEQCLWQQEQPLRNTSAFLFLFST